MSIESKLNKIEKLLPVSRKGGINIVGGVLITGTALLIAANPDAAAAFFAKLSSPSAVSSIPAVPTPGLGAMTVYQVENANPTNLLVTSIITDTVSFKTVITNTIPACSTSQIHLRDINQVSSPFNGAMTVSADQPMNARIVGYDYPPGVVVTTTINQQVQAVDFNGDGKITNADIQPPATRWGIDECNTAYASQYDIRNANGEKYPDGKMKTGDIQAVSTMWGMTYTLPITNTAQAAALKRPLAMAPQVDLKLQPSDITVLPGGTFTVSIEADNVTDLAGFEATLKYDPAKLQMTGTLLGKTSRPMKQLSRPTEDGNGIVVEGHSQGMLPAGDNGNVVLETFSFKAGGAGSIDLTLSGAEVNSRLNGGMGIRSITNAKVLISDLLHRLYLPGVFRLSPSKP
ncbi:MAG: cohesin domain-containing protein [Patescibacteria group bacterium]|nr:cohesin domain-containing protein [Patescibacteria group bacterium]